MSTAKPTSDTPPKVMFCGCKHEYQDEKYGKQMRVHNPDKKGDRYKCTVCGSQK